MILQRCVDEHLAVDNLGYRSHGRNNQRRARRDRLGNSLLHGLFVGGLGLVCVREHRDLSDALGVGRSLLDRGVVRLVRDDDDGRTRTGVEVLTEHLLSIHRLDVVAKQEVGLRETACLERGQGSNSSQQNK